LLRGTFLDRLLVRSGEGPGEVVRVVWVTVVGGKKVEEMALQRNIQVVCVKNAKVLVGRDWYVPSPLPLPVIGGGWMRAWLRVS